MFKKVLRDVFSNNINYLYLLILNLFAAIFQIFYIRSNFQNVLDKVPFWYTKSWSLNILADKEYLYTFPALTFCITLVAVLLSFLSRKFFLRYGSLIAFLICSFNSLFLTYSLLRIVSIASQSNTFYISQDFAPFILPFLCAFIFALFATPVFIRYAHEKGVVTQPGIHNHPAMVLIRPSARGAGFVYTAVFLISSIFFVTPNLQLIGIYIAMALIAVLGLVDDFQNTHPSSKSRFLENPIIRLLLLFIIVSICISFGLNISFITSLKGGIYDFSQINNLVGLDFADIFSKVITIIWIIWILNLLSWSNGIDGQYGGIVTVISLTILALALRYTEVTPEFRNVALLAVISAGASLGILPYSWNPSKIMWGFGAMSAGLALAGLSILINAKVATSALIMLIPFLDAAVTVIRRLFQRKNPLRGDRGHLHHLLLDRGWSPQKIAVFYWVTTALFGYIAITSTDQYLVRVTLILAGIVAFVIVLLNILTLKKNGKSVDAVKA